MRKPIMAGNWKMYKTIAQAVDFVKDLSDRLEDPQCEVLLCPPFTALAPLSEVIKGKPISLGAQNMHWEDEGAYTGEVAPGMLTEAGCRYVILGHSERRQYFGETDEIVNRKVLTAFRHNLTPIVCVGEVLEEREAGATEKVVRGQTETALAGITAQQARKLVIAYEPVWAIGTGRTASPEDAQNVNAFIREVLSEMFGREAAQEIRIQYGGSVKPDNAAKLMAQQDIDGALVGGASLNAAGFAAIVQAANGES